MKHLNIFIIYDGVHSADRIFERLDEVIPAISGKGHSDTEDYLICSDMTLPDETLEQLCFAMLTMPYKGNKMLTNFDYILSFYNLQTKMSYSEIKTSLEERGFQFSSASDNADILTRAFEWYYPVNQDLE